MPEFRPSLWFDTEAEQAALFYTSIFENSRITQVSRYGASGPGPEGSVMLVYFELDGTTFSAINGGPQFPHSEAISFEIPCADQDEVDRYWSALTADGGEESMCGWLKDRYGVSWQVVPRALGELMSTPDEARRERVTTAMLQMRKLDVATLERAAAG